jgi:hypothetical protein
MRSTTSGKPSKAIIQTEALNIGWQGTRWVHRGSSPSLRLEDQIAIFLHRRAGHHVYAFFVFASISTR